MNIIIERLQKVIELHEEIEKKNWDYVKEVCADDGFGCFEYKTEYIAPKGIRYDIIQVTDAKNYYKIFVYQDDKRKRKGIELVNKLLEAEKERQAKWEAEYDARIEAERREKLENVEKLQKVIDIHEEVKQRHWNWGMKACDYRNKYEEEHSMTTELKHNNKRYKIVQQTRISRNYTYYYFYVYENGVRIQKDIRFIKKMLKEEVA